MKKTMVITFVDGSTKQIDITAKKGIPLGLPANSEVYAQMCMNTCANGFPDETATDAKQITWIAPSQIKSCEIKFSDL